VSNVSGLLEIQLGSTLELILNPYVIESVRSACQRKARTLNIEMRRGLTSLASVSATASLLGLLGTLHGISTFPSTGGSRSASLYEIARALSQSLVTTALGLFVGVLALCAYRYLSDRVAKLQREMENQSIDLVNNLILHVRRSGNTQPLYFGEKSKKHLSAASHGSSFGEGITDAPLLQFDRIYRHGLLELLWPRLQSSLDADEVLQRGMWIAFSAGALSAWLYSSSPITAATVGVFLVISGRGIRRGSFFMTAGLSAFLLVFATGRYVLQSYFTASAFVWAVAAFCLAGSLRTAWAVTYGNLACPVRQPAHGRRYRSNALFVFWGAASLVALFPGPIFDPIFERDEVASNRWMEPGLHAHDQVVSIKVDWFGGIHRGNLVTFSQPWGRVDVARVVGIPSDQIQVKSGRLIRNGKLVDEPYCQIPYSGGLDDFPPYAQASLPDILRELQKKRFGSTLIRDKPFMVPVGAYFVLNDNRNTIFDSRLLGAIKKEMIIGRVILAYDADDRKWWHPKIIH
jgi:signal peptidase I